jgi:nickel-dependent lactate racemase
LGVDYQLIVALGRHKLMSEAELHQHLGTADAAQTCWDKDTLGVRCGITKRGTPVEIHPVLQEFDLLVVVGFVEPTYLAGFSGGPKLLVPGCASAQTISFNHSLVLLTGPLPGTMEGNEVYADLREAAAMAVREPFVVCVPLNTLGEPLGLYAGGWEAHKRAAVACRQGLSVAQRDVCDIVVTSPGGAPYDVDMVQAKKALPAAVRAVKPGGTVILVAKCPRGWGAVQPDRLSLAPDGHKRLRHLADRRRLGYVDEDWASLSPAVMFWHVRRKARLIIVTDMAAELEGTIAEPAASLEEAINKCCSLRSSLTFGLISDGRRVV